MELTRYYLHLLRRWLWLVLLLPLLAGGSAWVATQRQPTVYLSQARLIVGPGIDSPSPDLNALRTSSQLMQMYAELATTRPVLEAIIQQLDLELTPEELIPFIRIRFNEETQILTIQVQHPAPDLAVAIANALAEQLVTLSPAGANNPESQLTAQMHAEVAKLQQIIDDTEKRITVLETALDDQPASPTAPTLDTQALQLIIANTGSRIKQLEADYQALADISTQRRLSKRLVQEQSVTIEKRIQQLENELRNAATLAQQQQLLDQLIQEHAHLIEVLRSDVERQHLIVDQALQDIQNSTRERIAQLEAERAQPELAEIRPLLNHQLAQERNRLSDIQHTDLKRQRLLLEQALQTTNDASQTRISQLRNQLSPNQSLTARRQILNQIVQAYAELNSQQRAHIDQQHQVLDQILEVGLASTQATIEQMRTDAQVATATEQRQAILEQIATERDRLAQTHQSLALLYSTLQESTTNQIKIVEPATIAIPKPGQAALKALIAGLLGLAGALGLALAAETFNTRLKTRAELAQITNTPVWGIVHPYQASRKDSLRRLAAGTADETTLQAIQALGSRLYHLAQADPPVRSLLLTSTQATDDPNLVAAHLGLALAQTRERVVLVDGNLHQPALHSLFDIPNEEGLSTLLAGHARGLPVHSPALAPRLAVLPAGPVLPNPMALLTSSRIKEVIQTLEDQADLVLWSMTPTPSLANNLLLAPHLGGVLLVCYADQTYRDQIITAMDHLQAVNARIRGTILVSERPATPFHAPAPSGAGRLHRVPHPEAP